MRCRTGAIPTSSRRSTRSSTISPGRSRRTAISTAGTTAANPTIAGRTCATIMNSTTPATCSKARSPTFAPPGAGGFLDVMERYVDHIAATFGTGPGQKRGYPGHQEIELALVKLYRLTGDRRRLDLAAYFIDERGRQPHYFTEEALARGDDPARYWAKTYEYNQSHIPVREQTKMVGHAVRGDVHGLGDGRPRRSNSATTSLKRACEALWRDVTDGADVRDRRASGRARRTRASPSPTICRTRRPTPRPAPRSRSPSGRTGCCISISTAHYADVMERALYNGALSGLSREGTHYFYANPLESRGQHRRWAWHVCPCCTMNVSRLVASIGGYFAVDAARTASPSISTAASKRRVAIGGAKVALRETSDYPWSGDIRIEIDPEAPAAFDLKLRIPGWAKRRRGGCQWRAGRASPSRAAMRRSIGSGARATSSRFICRCRPSASTRIRACAWTSDGWR